MMMKKNFLLLALIFISANLFSNDIVGQWNGALRVPGATLRLVFHISSENGNYTATMDSPDQGAYDIPCDAVTFDSNKLAIELHQLGAKYSGVLEGDSIVGKFSQSGTQFPMNLKKGEQKLLKPNRPQEPRPPFPYYIEDVRFENEVDGVSLAGTLTRPRKPAKYPAVILITGSGAQDRNEEVFGHKPFWVIADYLTRNGFAVLRFDDRGTAESTGDFSSATSFDLSKDVEAAFLFLQERDDINRKKIGLMGHSEGGVIAPMVAARNQKVAFVVMLAGTGVQGDQLLLMQNEAIGRSSGIPEERIRQSNLINAQAYDIVLKSDGGETLSDELFSFFTEALSGEFGASMTEEQKRQTIDLGVEQLMSPWMQYFIKHNPQENLQKLKCPVLALNGTLDLQVPAKENLSGIETALKLAKNKKYKIVELEGLNHVFQEATTGSPNEYAQIEETFSPKALEIIKDWLIEIIR